jgi:copper oxidase (laccase) domain-containing protein
MPESPDCPYEQFPALSPLPVVHAFAGKVPGLDVKTDRPTAMERLDGYHANLRARLKLDGRHYITAEQVHGAEVTVVGRNSPTRVPGVDALVTDDPAVCLGIYVADCGPVLLVDPVRRVIGCAHSGRKGTDLGVVPATIEVMAAMGASVENIVVQLGPCIRPPYYEVDFAAEILRQCRAAGLRSVYDSGACTASRADRYYSYRREKGQTGRMLALLALA